MPRPLPPSLRGRSDRDAIFEDIAVYERMTLEERSRTVSELCALAARMLDASPNREKAWAFEEPRSAESLALWLRLIKERGGR